jgi:hypothetical protein
MSLERELSQLRAPDERAAQQRAWSVLRAAHRERTPVNRRRSSRLLALPPAVIAVVAIIAALALTPAGASVSRLIGRALGAPHAARALVPLPARGRLLVSAPGGTWIVTADGSQRRLGPWREASWSPHGLYIAVASRDEIAAVNPHGAIQWALARSAVSDPRWYPPTGFRVAYLSGNTLRVVAGDGSEDRLLATDVAAVAPAWRPDHPYQLAYLTRHQVVLSDTDSRRVIWARPADGARKLAWSDDGARLLILSHHGARILTGAGRTVVSIVAGPAPLLDGSLSPDGQALALVRGGSAPGVAVARLGSSHPRLSTLLSGPGMQQVLWSPNGRWLAISWPAADQWAFITVAGEPRIAAASRIAQQFHRGSHPTGFPRLDGWCCTLHGSAG